MRIYLVGYMGSGKTNAGRALARRIGYEFIDLDELFELRYRISVFDFFIKYDEPAFRLLEKMLLHETFRMEDVVVSTGGGTPCFFDNMLMIRQHGLSVYLSMKPELLAARLAEVRRKRPLLKDVPAEKLADHVAGQLARRETYYRQSDLTVEADQTDSENLAKTIQERVGR